MDNPEKLATQGTQDEEKQNEHNTICVGHHTQTNTNSILYRTNSDLYKCVIHI